MGLKNLKSRFDRHKIPYPLVPPGGEVPGPTIERSSGEGPNPANGDYFREGNTAPSDSPFDTVRELKMDQMVALLQEDVKSNNHSYKGSIGTITYKPAPISPNIFADLNGTFSTLIDPELGQFGGPYEGNFPD
tara:strand:+ start:260 stop:658 length:399 start_codon:yes stop_codon:yes gene_type:complete